MTYQSSFVTTGSYLGKPVVASIVANKPGVVIHSFNDVPVSSQYKISTMPKNVYGVKVDTKAR